MEPQQEHSPEQQARRHLLKLASYVPPAILGAMILGQRISDTLCGTKVLWRHDWPGRCRPETGTT